MIRLRRKLNPIKGINFFKISFLIFGILIISNRTIAQISIGGIINSYGRVTNVNVSSHQLTIDNISGDIEDFGVGKKLLLIQMKGASINNTNTSSYGAITSYGEAGNYEFVSVSSITGTNPYIITLEHITRDYNSSGGFLQVVTVPEYGNAIVSSDILATSWNGSLGRGGVIAFEVRNNLTLEANIIADGIGFRGGAVNAAEDGSTLNSTTYINDNLSNSYYGQKGEGIADFESSTLQFGRGAIANGGGGGNTHNAGGGGGGNYTAGGQGGSSYDNGGRGGNGEPGNKLIYNSLENKIFMGGGGGGGQQNNNVGTAGANGGGIILIRASSITSTSSHVISANGGSASSAGNDGAGGGGAGGTIFLDILNYNLVADLNINSHGGNGGTVLDPLAHGSGGGGGVGAIVFSSTPTNSFVKVVSNAGTSGNDCGFNCESTGTAGTPCSENCEGELGWTVPGETILLPVTLLNFHGKAINQYNKLTWETIDELNNDYFTIERSLNGFDFEAFEVVNGRGTIKQKQTYSFNDMTPFFPVTYYRLGQTDYNGEKHYLKIITVSNSSLSQNLKVNHVRPNPFKELLTVSYQRNKAGFTIIQLCNTGGRILKEEIVKSSKGNNSYTMSLNSSLEKGLYLLKISSENENPITIKVIQE